CNGFHQTDLAIQLFSYTVHRESNSSGLSRINELGYRTEFDAFATKLYDRPAAGSRGFLLSLRGHSISTGDPLWRFVRENRSQPSGIVRHGMLSGNVVSTTRHVYRHVFVQCDDMDGNFEERTRASCNQHRGDTPIVQQRAHHVSEGFDGFF